MEMLLMGGVLSLFGMAVVCLAFGAATRSEVSESVPQQQPQTAAKPAPARFFAAQPSAPIPLAPRVPIEALLLQIENHVRLEHAAAESFVEYPTAALLHSRTISTLIQ